jgi:uncharacterized membrane protein
MSWAEIWLFGHLVAAILWIGAGFSLVVLAVLADRTRDSDALKHVLEHTNRLANVYFIPASFAVLVFGIALVVQSEFFEFSMLWITLGLVGYALTFGTGIGVIKPRAEKIGRMLEESGGVMTPEALLAARKLLTIARIDYVVLFLVVFDMVTKPTGDDVGLLVFMAAVLVAGTAYFALRARSLGPGEPAADLS